MAIAKTQRANGKHDHLNDNQISRHEVAVDLARRKETVALLSTWALVVTRFIEPVTHRSHLDRCAQPRLDLSGSSQSNHLPSTPPLTGVLQLRFVLPHTLRSTGVLDGVVVPAATRSRRFGLKWRVAVALSSASAAFLDVGRCVMCLCHALHGMQAL